MRPQAKSFYGNGIPCCTVQFFYRGTCLPTLDSAVTSDYGLAIPVLVLLQLRPPKLRCDDPVDHANSIKKPLVMSVLTLTSVVSYVGTVANANKNYSLPSPIAIVHINECDSLPPAPRRGVLVNTCSQNYPHRYQNGTGHALPATNLGYSAKLSDNYLDVTIRSVASNYQVTTNWQYLTSYMDLSNGVGASIAYLEAHGNTGGMPRASDGDNRYDPFLCTTHSRTSAPPTRSRAVECAVVNLHRQSARIHGAHPRP